MEMNRSIIRWAGSKRQLIPKLLEYVPEQYDRYIEPFAGSACLFFSLDPKRSILGDINAELMLTYRQIRKSPEELHSAIARIPRTPAEYYKSRAINPKTMNVFDRATRFMYLNRNCFNGVYRLNRSGAFNVPWGNKTGDIPSLEEFKRCASTLRRAKLMVTDFEELLSEAKRGDFVYLDPPYSKSVAGEPGLFGSGAFGPPDLARLVKAIKSLDKRGAHYLLSFENAPELKNMLPGTSFANVSVRRNVSGFSGARKNVFEVLISNVMKKV